MSTVEITQKGEVLGHPKGLYVLFGAEMWERFSYYGMRALLVLYLTKHLKFERADALEVYGTYTGLVYLTPLLGGGLADRYLGPRKAVLVGGLLMALGHFAMAFEPLLNYALGLLILGNGFFKPNISTMVGQLYPKTDKRRDAGYSIFYMGINLGVGIAPLVCGTLGEKVGWHYGFAAAGIGMVFGLIMFWSLQSLLGPVGFPLGRRAKGIDKLTSLDFVHVVILALLGTCLVYLALAPFAKPLLSGPKAYALLYWTGLALLMVPAAALVTGQSRKRDKMMVDELGVETTVLNEAYTDESGGPPVAESVEAPLSNQDWLRVAVILIVGLFSSIFWMAFEQAGGTLTLFADQKTNRSLFGMSFPTSWYQSVNALLILALAPPFIFLWTKVRLNSAAKMGLGLVIVGVGFTLMRNAEGMAGVSTDGKVGPEWLVYVYLCNTIGELCLSPIGLSLVNKLAPAKLASLMMASWFMFTAAGNYAAAILEKQTKAYHLDFWGTLVVLTAVPGLVLFLCSPILNKMSGKRL